jgi:GDP-D-mannose 3',5'-epimerase
MAPSEKQSAHVAIGSREMVTISQLVDMAADIAGKQIGKKHIPGAPECARMQLDNR